MMLGAISGDVGFDIIILWYMCLCDRYSGFVYTCILCTCI